MFRIAVIKYLEKGKTRTRVSYIRITSGQPKDNTPAFEEEKRNKMDIYINANFPKQGANDYWEGSSLEKCISTEKDVEKKYTFNQINIFLSI